MKKRERNLSLLNVELKYDSRLEHYSVFVTFGKDYAEHFGTVFQNQWRQKSKGGSLITIILAKDDDTTANLNHFESFVRSIAFDLTPEEKVFFKGMARLILCLLIRSASLTADTQVNLDAMNMEMANNYESYVDEFLRQLSPKYGKVPDRDDLTMDDERKLLSYLKNIDWNGFSKLVQHYESLSFRGTDYETKTEVWDLDDVYSAHWLESGEFEGAPIFHMSTTVGAILKSCDGISQEALSQISVTNNLCVPICGACGNQPQKMSYCAGCLGISYCGISCQKAHWHQHVLHCNWK